MVDDDAESTTDNSNLIAQHFQDPDQSSNPWGIGDVQDQALEVTQPYTFQGFNPLQQGFSEIDLSVHGLAGNFFDYLFRPRDSADFVNHFTLDEGFVGIEKD